MPKNKKNSSSSSDIEEITNRADRPKRPCHNSNRMVTTTRRASLTDDSDSSGDDSSEEYQPSPKKRKENQNRTNESQNNNFDSQFDALMSSKMNSTEVPEAQTVESNCNCGSMRKIDEKWRSKIEKKLNEILAIISVQQNFMNDQNISKSAGDAKILIDVPQDPLEIFMKSNCLPAKNINELNAFEQKLDDEAFQNASVSQICTIFSNSYLFSNSFIHA